MTVKNKKLNKAQIFAICAAAILLISTIFWSLLGACVQQGNADQLIDPLMFSDWATFLNAQFPGSHTFLFKWPLFWLVSLLNCSTIAYVYSTVILCVLTIALFEYFLFKIEKRPMVFGVVCLSLSSILLLIPTQPYAGALLPVGMSMLTTRNLEYILYIFCVYLLVRSLRMSKRDFIWATIGLALLFASDKIFLAISLAGSLLAIVVHVIYKKREMLVVYFMWIGSTILAWMISAAMLAMIDKLKITHIVNSSDMSPYSAVLNIKEFVSGVLYAVLDVFTNFGANPAFDAVAIKDIPIKAWQRMTSVSGIAFAANFTLCCMAIAASAKTLGRCLKGGLSDFFNKPFNRLSIIMIWSAIATLCIFIFSNHYYPVDSRYVSITFFAGVIILVNYYASKPIDIKEITLAAVALCICIFAAGVGAVNNYNSEIGAMSDASDRNETVAKILEEHNIKNIVGNYWRVVPVKMLMSSDTNVVPLDGCTALRVSLTSEHWNINYKSDSFAYILSFDENLGGFPQCTQDDVTSILGEPTSTIVVSGTEASPNELLFIYDNSNNGAQSAGSVEIQDDSLASLETPACSNGTELSIVAHEDDDILFMNPDISSDISAAKCAVSVYITAGDAGGDQNYWLSRQKAAEAAYANMAGVSDIWEQQDVTMPGGQVATIANLALDNNIYLIFLRLPDGNLEGQGFASTGYQSLAKLLSGSINEIQTVDGNAYDKSELVAALSDIIKKFSPDVVRTQSQYSGKKFQDHSDHIATAQLASEAFDASGISQYSAINNYLGYTVREFEQDVTGDSLTTKTNTFLVYAKYDSAVCSSLAACEESETYGNYLKRQYRYNY